jgi:hypothetical protein
MHLIALVDSQVGSLAGELDDSTLFLCVAQIKKCSAEKQKQQDAYFTIYPMSYLTRSISETGGEKDDTSSISAKIQCPVYGLITQF